VVIAGTGAVAIAFKRTSNGEVVQAGRTGGWGHLVGDHGSAFDIGKRALQTVLTSLEQSQGDDTYQLTELEAGILARLNCSKEDLLSTILRPSGQSKQQIGDLAKVVTELGFRADRPDRQAWAILQSAAGCLVQLIRPLSKKQICEPSKSSLVLSGALMNLSANRDFILDEWAGENLDPFKKVVVVNDASSCAVQFLANQAAAAEREPTKTAQESKTAKKVEDSLSGR
jgi:N-acetylmuramic acid 6-phosphate etherase